MKFYLAGKIPKGTELDNYDDWRIPYTQTLRAHLTNVEILDPHSKPSTSIKADYDPLFWFGHDSLMIREADVTLIQGNIKLGAGTAQEMLIAKYFNKPVVTILPKDTHHRRSNLKMLSGMVEDWIHPFLSATSDAIFETLEEATVWLQEYEKDPASKKIKTITVIDEAITHYQAMIQEYNAA